MDSGQDLIQTPFEFLDPGRLVDGDMELVLAEKYPGNPAIAHVPAYKFKMTAHGVEGPVGDIQLRVGNLEAICLYFGHIGYGVGEAHRGHRYAARSICLLKPLIRHHDLRPLWITCDPANVASRRTCEIAGAHYVETLDLPEDTDLYRNGHRQGCRYRLDV